MLQHSSEQSLRALASSRPRTTTPIMSLSIRSVPQFLALIAALLAAGCASTETTGVQPFLACGAGEGFRILAGLPRVIGPPSSPGIIPGSSVPPLSPGVPLAPGSDLGNPDVAADIIVIRIKSFFAHTSRWVITLDGTELYAICPNDYFSVRATPGQHTIGLKWCGGSWPGWHEKTLVLAIQERQKYYFLVKPSFAGADIEAADEQAGQRELAGRNRLP